MFVKKGNNWTVTQVGVIPESDSSWNTYLRLELKFQLQVVVPPHGYNLNGHESELTRVPADVTVLFWLSEGAANNVFAGEELNMGLLFFKTETLREFPPTTLINDPIITMVCEHPWFTMKISGLTREQAQEFGTFQAPWYLIEIERRTILNIQDADPQPILLKAPHKELYLREGAHNVVPHNILWLVSILRDEVPELRRWTRGWKHQDQSWQELRYF